MSDRAVTRRAVLAAGSGAGVGLAAGAGRALAQTPELTVTEALMARRSTRQFAPRGIDAQLRRRILWAAFGVNRPDVGGHTAPSWRGANDAMVHVADDNGVGLYDPVADSVTMVLTQDIRARLSPQPFVATAPLCLIHVSDLDRLTLAAGAPLPADEARLDAHVNAAVIAQNVYLICAALGLGTCLVGGADRAAIAAALGLGERRLVTYVQPIGWPS